MSAIVRPRVPAWTPAVPIVSAAGLLLLLSACAPNYRAACIDAGAAAGSPELESCVQQKAYQARLERRRHLKYSGGR